MEWIRELLKSFVQDGRAMQVQVGAFLTAVVLERETDRSCGLASTLREEFHPGGRTPVEEAGSLHERSGKELARLAFSFSPTEISIGMAALNALVQLQKNDLEPWMRQQWQGVNAERLIGELGRDRSVALVGHFPFIDHIRERVGRLWVLEQHPCAADLPAEAAPEIVPQADVLAMTSMTLTNGTFDGLMRLRKPEALTILLGPGTPLTPTLFDQGVDILAGAVVQEIEPVARSVAQGATFRQARASGVRFVTLSRRQIR